MLYLQKELPRLRKVASIKKKRSTPRVVSISLVHPPVSYRTGKISQAKSWYAFWCPPETKF